MNKLALILVATIALSLVILNPMMSLAQQQPQTGNKSQDQIDVPLNFSLKVKGGEHAKDKNATKDVTVNLSVHDSQGGSPAQIPLTAKVQNDTKMKDLELCASLIAGKEMCSSLKEVVKAQGQNQSSGASSNESSSSSGNSTDKNKDYKR